MSELGMTVFQLHNLIPIANNSSLLLAPLQVSIISQCIMQYFADPNTIKNILFT